MRRPFAIAGLAQARTISRPSRAALTLESADADRRDK
jgi:hypothetical protein